MSDVKIRIQPYTDAFDVGCAWMVGMKYGDGSDMHCDGSACCRVIFDNGGRTMLCQEHRDKITNQRPEDVIFDGPGAEGP